MDNQNNIQNPNVAQQGVGQLPQQVPQQMSQQVVQPVAQPVQPNQNVQPAQVPNGEAVQTPVDGTQAQPAPPKKKSPLGKIFVFLLIVGLGGVCFMFYQKNLETVDYYENYYSPINATKDTELDINSTVVQDLYNRFKTTAQEDYYGKDITTNNMKLYIAFKNVSYNNFIDSNCNMFDNTKMQYISCPNGFIPKAVDEEAVMTMLKVLYGDNHGIKLGNIQISNTCLGGYQYISGRKQFVQGKCSGNLINYVKAEKSIVRATTNNKVITIREKVRYFSTTEKVPDYLKSGIYIYTFRLDANYNYVFMNKEYSEEIG